MGTILQVEHLEKYYGNKGNLTKAIDDLSFSVEQGEYIGIMGASGSGKTTLLNCISTIDRASAGHIYVEGKDITAFNGKKLAKFRREELGFIFQDFNLLDTLNAFENIALALTLCGTPPKKLRRVYSTLRGGWTFWMSSINIRTKCPAAKSSASRALAQS